MTAERDIAGFVLPFTLGVALTMAIHEVITDVPIYIRSISLLIVAACLYALLHPSSNKLNSNILWAIIIGLGLCCGFLCCEGDYFNPTLAQTRDISILESAADFGQKMKSIISSVPFEDSRTCSIATALITGDKSGLTTDTINIFRKSGASHILALSGMHLGIIYGLLKLILWGLGSSRIAKFIKSGLTILICGYYTLSTGAGPSIVRAFIFIMTAEIAQITGRHNSLRTILYSSLLIQLILTPAEIRDVGFQLSYAAIAGIAYIFPKLRDLWPADKADRGLTIKGLKWIWDCSSLSVACQITTAPIAFAYFGTFPKYFLITNLLAIPLVTLIIPMGLLTVMLTGCGLCPGIIVSITEGLIDALVYCLSVISSL